MRAVKFSTITKVPSSTLIACSILLSCFAMHAAIHTEPQDPIEQSNVDQNDQATVMESIDEISDEPISVTQEPQDEVEQLEGRIIKSIVVTGNKQIPTSTILHRIPYRIGEKFDSLKTRDLIKNLYSDDLKRFRSVAVLGEPVGADKMNLHVVLEEKKILKDYQFKGNVQVSAKEILEEIPFGSMPAVDPEELKVISAKIKKLYAKKGYHLIDIHADLSLDEQDKATATFTFTEYPKSLVKRINFTGNNCVSAKQLRSVIFSREDWILSFMDRAGTYQPEMLEGDRHMIEQYYQNEGYLNARVTDVQVNFDECNNIHLVFDISEGEQYTINQVTIEDTDGIPGEQLVACLPLAPGTVYSRERVMDSIKSLEHLWGGRGYLFANVEPSIVPNEADHTVDISFRQELGDRVYLNKLTVIGNQKTRDKIIRRQILVEEGDILTESALEATKNRIQSLGYFDVKDGVSWKIHRLGQNLADVDLIVKEAKTGHASMQLGYGGTASLNSPADALSAELSVSDNNLLGYGIAMNLSGRFAKSEKTFIANITQPWLFDRPIMGAVDVYHKRLGYEEFRLTNAINEHRTGGALTTGFVTVLPRFYFTDIFFRCNLGLDSIKYDGQLIANAQALNNPLYADQIPTAQGQYTLLLAKEFHPGLLGFIRFTAGQEKKNHPNHPSRGYAWVVQSFTGIPTLGTCIGFEKVDFDYHWYTPMIGEYDLIFHFHSYLGCIMPFRNQTIPFGELFHIGGPSSVRGFLFGDLSPRFRIGNASDSIGAAKAFWVNAELIFPIKEDMTMKGVFFYDGGSGWDTPFFTAQNAPFIINNNFDYRHAVGAGIRMLNPMPIKIDVGFKLDPRKGESPYEVHFGMTADW